jgi:acyl-CoA synthetase (AMP-forming)/AMP-acid ligase II
LKQGARGSTDARGRLRGALVVVEVAFALVLLGGAGLLARSFMRLTHVDPGFVPEHATVLRLALPEKKYEKSEQQLAFADALLSRLRVLPGVQAAGLTHSLPLISDWVLGFKIEGRPEVRPADLPNTNYYSVTPDYFPAMGVRLIRGRLFNQHDDARAPRVAVINETLARQFFPHEDPIGKRILVTNGPDVWRQIVGIVGRSGDKYTMDADGYYTYAGRTDDMLKVSGMYVSPFEVEAALVTHPDVLEVAVIGMPDEQQLIKPKAYVVAKPGVKPDSDLAEALKQHVKDRLAPFKYPRWVEFLAELPKTATGKIQRFKLRARD